MIESIETSQDILDKINDETNQYSGLYSVVKDFQSLVGGIEYDNKGNLLKSIDKKSVKSAAVATLAKARALMTKMRVTIGHL